MKFDYRILGGVAFLGVLIGIIWEYRPQNEEKTFAESLIETLCPKLQSGVPTWIDVSVQEYEPKYSHLNDIGWQNALIYQARTTSGEGISFYIRKDPNQLVTNGNFTRNICVSGHENKSGDMLVESDGTISFPWE